MKIITTKKGHDILVSDEDFEWLSKYTWNARKKGNTMYARTRVVESDGTIKYKFMHRMILGLTDPIIFVDHKDRNGLNNTRENIREATNSQNQMNKIMNNGNKKKGVSFYKGKWSARIQINKKSKYLGRFDTEELAFEAYKKEAKKLFGEFANTD